MISINLQKAFDTIDYQILVTQMKYLGFSRDGKFQVNIGKCISSPANVLCGVIK